VTGDLFNLIAAVLCTIGAGASAVAMFISEPNLVNIVAGLGSALGFAGGIAWTVAAVLAVRERR
jgi:hypothetical protein